MSEALLREIGECCRNARMAESTFGRLAVNDGKLVSRLRLGGRITTKTADRVPAFIGLGPPVGSDRPPRRSPGGLSSAARRTPQFPLLRQPPEVSAVRNHVQREVGGGP